MNFVCTSRSLGYSEDATADAVYADVVYAINTANDWAFGVLLLIYPKNFDHATALDQMLCQQYNQPLGFYCNIGQSTWATNSYM